MKKILIIRFSSIGDIVLTTPVIRCLKQQLGAEIHFLTKKRFQQVVDPNPYIDQVHAIDKKLSEVMPQLKRIDFDYIIDLHRNLRSLQVKLALRAPSHSFDKLNWQKWLMVRFKVNRLPDIHIVDRYLATTLPLGIQKDGQGLDYFIPEADEVDTTAILPENAQGYIVFVIGAAHATKRLPESKIIAMCKKISQPVILLGGPGEKEVGESIAAAAGEHVVNTCGHLRLHQSASVVRQAERVISHDTGLMHVAAAFQKEIISIWGNTIPEFGMYPYYGTQPDRNTTQQISGLSCRPCSKIGYQQCPKGHFKCMMEQEEEVLKIPLK